MLDNIFDMYTAFINSKILFVLIAVILFTTPAIMSQESSTSTVNNQLWLDFNPKWQISERTDLRGKVGAKSIYPRLWRKLYTTAEISYSIPKNIFKKLQYNERAYAGIDFYYVFFVDLPDVIEISPYQGYTLTWPNRERLDLRHNVELGQRFQWGVTDWDFSFGLKLSYEATFVWKFKGDLWQHGQGFFLSASAKFWWNLISTTIFNDVVRITPGLGYQINPAWKAAFYVGYNYTRNLTAEEFNTDNIIYRLRLYYTIPGK
jgi:hypothetical protein